MLDTVCRLVYIKFCILIILNLEWLGLQKGFWFFVVFLCHKYTSNSILTHYYESTWKLDRMIAFGCLLSVDNVYVFDSSPILVLIWRQAYL